MVALVLSACGGAAEAPTVATAGGSSAQPTGSAGAVSGPVAQYVEGQRQWVNCLRKEGFDLPDPDAKGRVDLSAPDVPKKTDQKWRAAQEKCKGFSLPIPDELEEKGPPVTAEQIAHRREYAKCMRANGMPDWPDPGPDGEWPQAGSMSRELTPQEQALNIRALQICEPVLDGRPKTTANPNGAGRG
ncbi:hypothetical protein [Micromonospora sp. KC721]|uniref:hypothetical protein n=1 Tax=Micromonospora sp. KC721 TaxID=2530380 RepID=UPI00104B2C33|nr:hypothetical protein [Micromonospora sp. KC721]TDB79475.1 hypothetical protein E1182_12440 [Micromonospora sp. KC721]